MNDATEMQAWIAKEQVRLWTDFLDRLQSAVNGRWSMGASNVGVRILEAAQLVGPSEPSGLPWELFAGGVVEALYGVMGIEVANPDEAEWRRLDALMEWHGGTRAACTPRWAATVAEIKKDAAWLRQDDAP